MAKTPDAPVPDADASTAGPGKNRPTPSRAEQEAARKRPLVADTKEARQRARSDLQSAREKARVGMAAGDEKYLPMRDKGPQRRFARDYVDSGWHLGELLMPLMIVAIVLTLGPQILAFWAFVGLWIYVLFAIGDMIITSISVKKAIRKKFGENNLEKGVGWYAAMRTVQMRFMRLPKPQVRRGQKPA